MASHDRLRGVVLNFNAPELNYLAQALAGQGELLKFIRTYVNKNRLWERALSAAPLIGGTYRRTFGRRTIDHPALLALTEEAGVGADFAAAAVLRMPLLTPARRHRLSHALYEAVRLRVAAEGARLPDEANCVVSYQGFAKPAFKAMGVRGSGKSVLNYPIAHHREQFQVRREECEREPEFAETWPGFDDWAPGYEEQLDEEIERADSILVGSSYARDSFVRQGVAPGKLFVAPYGVDHSLFYKTARTEAAVGFNVIYAGVLTQRKGLSYLLRAWRRFHRPDSKLTLVGAQVASDKPLRPFADMIELVPHLTRPELAQRYRTSDVFVFPTLLEGMGLVVLEAMACGLPVIVTANGPGDIVRDGIDGYVVPARDEDALVDRLETLYRDPEQRRTMGESAARRSLEFGWDAYAARVRSHLHALIALGSADARRSDGVVAAA